MSKKNDSIRKRIWHVYKYGKKYNEATQLMRTMQNGLDINK